MYLVFRICEVVFGPAVCGVFAKHNLWEVGGEYGNRVSGCHCRESGNTMSHKGQPLQLVAELFFPPI